MDAVSQHKAYAPRQLGFAVLTVSDSRQPTTDGSGQLIRELVVAAGHRVLASAIVPDEAAEIREQVLAFLSLAEMDVAILSGGTGFSPRDVTLPAVRELFDTEVVGFGELFRLLSYREVGAAAMLSRATAGVVGERVIFLLPGSPRAVGLAMRELILPEAGHLLGQLRRPAAAP